ncbi:MAG: YeeE/YedE family protein [Pseudomonadota bacterium]
MSTALVPAWQSLAGGALIGAGAAVLVLSNGRTAGIGGILDKLLHGAGGVQAWRLAFIAGLLLPAVIAGPTLAGAVSSPEVLAISGILVGYGSRIGGGCTSGHGICGVANLSPRSLAATATFLAFATLTVALRHALVSA